MTTDPLRPLLLLLAKRSLAVLRFGDGVGEALLHSRHGVNRFTIVRPHEELDDLKLPTLCLVELPYGKDRECYVGVVTAKAAVATFDSRLTIIRLQFLQIGSIESIVERLRMKQFRTLLNAKLEKSSVVACLSPALSIEIIKTLSRDAGDKQAIEKAASYLPGLRKITSTEWAQTDAIKMALQAFGLDTSAIPRQIDLPEDTDSALEYIDASVLEDNVIARDATVIPGYQLIDKYVTGQAIFEKGGERLYVYTANKGPLEEMLGVDLIYVNEVAGNTVMVQYKMLKPDVKTADGRTDWIFRPDTQFRKEIDRMRLPAAKKAIDDYRLNCGPFYFKFVRRKGTGISHQSFTITLDHLSEILKSPESRGSRGGVRVSYKALGRSYLREANLTDLIHSGYIGTHRVESDALNPLIKSVSQGNRALVLAWQREVH